MKVDWENLGKRMIAANQLGIRIEQDSGHRWILVDEDADFLPEFLKQIRSKHYGSYQSALDEIDKILAENKKSSLIETFENNINYCNDLGVVFGAGTQ